MKNKISFLAILAFAFSAGCANASECSGSDCDLEPVVIEQIINTNEICESGTCESEITLSTDSETVCEYDYNCPFETAEECAIWYKKPEHKTSLEPRAPHINPIRTDDILYSIYANGDITANENVAAPLLERYQMLMRASKACCTEGIIHKMRANGADERQVYDFLKDDANYYAIGTRCLVMKDEDIAKSYSNGVTGQMLADVRNSCLCKNRQWFDSLLTPFRDIYYRAPKFEQSPFTYKYTDGMQREITVSINNEVQTTMGLLGACPK